MSTLYYMRDNHTFLPLPPDDVDAAIAAIRHTYVDEGYSCGMLCTKRVGAPESVHGMGRARWDEFEVKARRWLTEVTDAPPELSAEQVDEFRRHPGTFAAMVQNIYSSGWNDARRASPASGSAGGEGK